MVTKGPQRCVFLSAAASVPSHCQPLREVPLALSRHTDHPNHACCSKESPLPLPSMRMSPIEIKEELAPRVRLEGLQ